MNVTGANRSWTIRVVIRGINEDLKNPLFDEEEKKELMEEREGLKKRKRDIAEFLGLVP